MADMGHADSGQLSATRAKPDHRRKGMRKLHGLIAVFPKLKRRHPGLFAGSLLSCPCEELMHPVEPAPTGQSPPGRRGAGRVTPISVPKDQGRG